MYLRIENFEVSWFGNLVFIPKFIKLDNGEFKTYEYWQTKIGH